MPNAKRCISRLVQGDLHRDVHDVSVVPQGIRVVGLGGPQGSKRGAGLDFCGVV